MSRRLVGPLVLAAVLVAALVVGSGALDAASPSGADRVAGLERLVAAPPHSDLSVAQSDSPSSIALRDEIAAAVARGESNGEILGSITRRYGTQILLEPPAGPLTTVLWAVPVALAAGAVLVGGAALVRRRRRT